jgi:cell wall-associated NlpC family hydrolase
MGLPWWVMAPSGPWTRYDPRSRPVLGRRFVFGVDDCWSICRDWFGREMGLAMPDFEREPNFWETGFEPHVEHLAAAGFVPVPFGGLQRGDGLLFRVCAKTITHCAVYLGDGWMLHHIEGMLSRKEPVDRRWMKRLAMVVRHESRVTP